ALPFHPPASWEDPPASNRDVTRASWQPALPPIGTSTLAPAPLVLAQILPFKDAPVHEGADSDEFAATVHGALRPFEIPKALPWDARSPAPPVPVTAAHQPLAQPALSLEQHASLCLEIAIDPAREEEALVRYQVTAAGKACADEYYR